MESPMRNNHLDRHNSDQTISKLHSAQTYGLVTLYTGVKRENEVNPTLVEVKIDQKHQKGRETTPKRWPKRCHELAPPGQQEVPELAPPLAQGVPKMAPL